VIPNRGRRSPLSLFRQIRLAEGKLRNKTIISHSSRVLQKVCSPLRQKYIIATETTRRNYRQILRPHAGNTVVTGCSNHPGGSSFHSNMKGPNESRKEVFVKGSDTWYPHVQSSHQYSYMERENIVRHRKASTGGQRDENIHLAILVLSEMRWTGADKLISEDVTVLHSGGNKHERGVGILLSNR